MDEHRGQPAASPVRPRPVLMIPLACGGALRRCLDASAELHAPPALHIADFLPFAPLYGDLADDRNYFRLVVDVIGLQAAGPERWSDGAFDPVAVFEALHDAPRNVHRIAWELAFQAGARREARVVVDGSRDAVQYARELLALFPDLLLLNVVRDPRAQVAEMNRALAHDFDSYLNAAAWVEAHALARELAVRHPDKVLTVRYEDFLVQPETVLRRICRFLDIGYRTGMCEVAAPIDAPGRELSREEIEVIETLAGELMGYYGYERRSRGRAMFGAEFVRFARERSEVRRRQAWDELATSDHRDYVLREFRADYLKGVRDRMTRAAAGRGPAAARGVTVAGEHGRPTH